ncbi:MAG: ABC transporter substrate-binding protein [Myxococcota bacterium]|nr:ABC transporter substrate-binding protein [Myxococcota bacterium]
MQRAISWIGAAGLVAGLTVACQPAAKMEEAKPQTGAKVDAAKPVEALRGVDMEKKVIRIGMLNDETGPAAIIGKPFAIGKRILAKQVNEGGSGLLPEGWTLELVEKDHGYNPGKSEAAYKELKDQVLFIGTSFGTPPTLPLRPYLKQDNMVAFPASLSSAMATFEHTPPVGASYSIEAMRAVDWIVESVGADKAKLAIVYDQTDYGKDGFEGFKKAAEFHRVPVVAEQTVAPGQKDFTAVVGALKKAGATHVLLTVLASSTGPVLGTAAKMKYMPTWVGQTPSWIDPFFAHPQLPAVVFTKYVWMNGLPFWGEPKPGMDKFLAAFQKHGAAMKARPDFYTMTSYLQGLLELEAVNRAIANNDLTPTGFMTALRSIDGWNAGGLLEGMSFKEFPYSSAKTARILKPDFAKKSWAVVADYAAPKMLVSVAPAAPAENTKAEAK